MDFAKFRRKVTRLKARHQAFQDYGYSLDDFYRVCLRHVAPVAEPLALISQIQRSGGSLLSQLFDGHPEIHAHPHELKIGYPKKYNWPDIDLGESHERWFKMLFEDSVIRLFKEGYKKEPTSDVTFPFIFLPALQKKIFLQSLETLPTIKLRHVFDAYMTSYFGAWLNNQNSTGPKKIITAFTPRMAMVKSNMETFFEVYPDGRLISIVRNPKNWFPSALRHNAKIKKDKYADIEIALDQWKENAQAMVWTKQRFDQRVCIIRFEDLISDIEGVMRHLAEFLNIKFDVILLTPTFNKSLITANTSFNEDKPGIVKSTLSRHQTLSPGELGIIAEITQDVYREVLTAAVAF